MASKTERALTILAVFLIWSAFAVATAILIQNALLLLIPIVLMGIAVIVVAGVLIYRAIVPQAPDAVYVGRTRVTSCLTCPMMETQENPVATAFPIMKCRETAKMCYNPTKIPGWCPYVH